MGLLTYLVDSKLRMNGNKVGLEHRKKILSLNRFDPIKIMKTRFYYE